MTTYEITATVAAELCDAYERYMREHHIPDLLATRCFDSAVLTKSSPGRYRIRYEAPDDAALARYLSDHAPRLRGDFLQHFPSGIDLQREIWSSIQSWPAGDSRS